MDDSHSFIQAHVVSLGLHHVTVIRPSKSPHGSVAPSRRNSAISLLSVSSNTTYGCFDGPEETIYFDLLRLCTGKWHARSGECVEGARKSADGRAYARPRARIGQ